MNYNGAIYRPPVEADTFLVPVTEGCTHNSCSFCNMYQGVPFRMLSLSEIEEFLREVRHSYGGYCDGIRRAYLVGADPFALSAKRLLERIDLIRKYLPNLEIITMYARTDNIAAKSNEDLRMLKEAGVDDLYIGVECGLNDVLENLNKGYSADETREQCLRLNAVGIKEMNIKVLGGGCSRCEALLKAAKQAAANKGIEAEIEYITDMEKIMNYGVMSMPALMVDDKIVSAGKVLKAKEVEKYL